MSTSANPQIIIIKKKKAGHGGHHGGAWKVAYADFVTAMMALFIVLWLLSSSEKVKKAVGGYFQDPTGQGKMQGSTNSGVGEDLKIAKDDMNKLKQMIESAMQKEVANFEKLKENVQLTITSEGLRIELLETAGGFFFESGKAVPTGSGEEVLTMLGQEVGKLPNQIVVEGHTDANPFSSNDGYTNWELSADRANAARRVMMGHGLRADQVVQVRGFADQRLRLPNDPKNPLNRRVSVIVRFREQPDLPPDSAPPKQGGGEKSTHETVKPGSGH